jgi:hypothetical protein
MPRRPAKVTQADIARAIRAAKETGAGEVMVDAYGQIHIAVSPMKLPPEIRSTEDEQSEPETEKWEPSKPVKPLERHRRALKGI